MGVFSVEKSTIAINSVEESIAINSVEKSITINSVEKNTINSLLENTFNKMSVIKIASIVLISVCISLAARAPDASDPVNFNVFPGPQFPVLSGINTAPTEPRDGRQSVLGCLKGCTRELRPVRGVQGGRERILPNKCTFDVEACKSKRSRGAPLILSQDQSNIVYPSTGGK